MEAGKIGDDTSDHFVKTFLERREKIGESFEKLSVLEDLFPEAVGEFRNRLLISVCERSLEEFALTILHSVTDGFDYIDKMTGNNALIMACKNRLDDVALELITTKRSDLDRVNNDGETALTWACSNEMFEVANSLIDSGRANPSQVDRDGNTALILACSRKMEPVALRLVKTGEAKIEHVNKQGDNALLIACRHGLESVAIELIRTKKFGPSHANNEGETLTSLIHAKKLTEVLYELIKICPPLTHGTEDTLCMCCYEKATSLYHLFPCDHAFYIHEKCLRELTKCPYCRKKINKRCVIYLQNIV